jgi:hypothetical protein
MEKDFGFIFLSNGRFSCVMHDEYGEATLTVLQALMMAGWQLAACKVTAISKSYLPNFS